MRFTASIRSIPGMTSKATTYHLKEYIENSSSNAFTLHKGTHQRKGDSTSENNTIDVVNRIREK